MTPTLACEAIHHCFGQGALAETVLDDVGLELLPGQASLLMGPSGSGKTTLLSILGCLLSPSSGRVWIEGQLVEFRSQTTLGLLRRSKLGFVFQHARLLPFLSVRENLTVIGRNGGLRGKELAQRVEELTDRLGIQSHLTKLPAQLSGGQQQRVAIARALMLRPAIILADEPTAALDWKHGQEAVQLLVEQAQSAGASLLTVTHDARLRPLFDRVFNIDGGKICEVEP